MNYPIPILVLSHSSRSTFHTCARKFEFTKMFGDAPRLDEENDLPAQVGHALHAGFQEYLTSGNETMANIRMLMRYPYEKEYLDPRVTHGRTLEACYNTLATMIRSPVVDKYQLVWIKHNGITKPAVEVPFAIEIIGSGLPIPVWFIGFIDAILNKIIDPNYFVVNDIKTTRRWITDTSALYEYDEQTVPYGIVLEHLLEREIQQFDVSYLSTYVDLIEPKAVLYPFTKTEAHIQDWVRGLVDDLLRLKRYMNQGWFPRSTTGNACMSFGRSCFATEICAFRDIPSVSRMIGGTPRTDLFQTDRITGKAVEPWVKVQLNVEEYM